MKVILFLLENPFIHGDKIALIIPAKPDDSSICRLYSLQTGKEYGFGCTQEHFQPQGSALSIYAESLDHRKYMAELYVAIDDCRRIMQLGSVHFYAKNKQNSQVNIGMLNPFADFPASFCPQALILGGTSYIELAKVIDNFAALGYVIEWLDFDQSLLGSIDEGLNLYSGLMIRDRGISTRLKASKRVASGGTHLFISGNRRRIELSHPLEPIERTKRLGVHSWKGQSGQSQAMISARALPLNHESHAEQATFYQRMLGESGRNFYLLTLQAAAPEQMYYFRIDEAKRHGLITEVAISSTALSSTGSAKL
ncbi:MAG: hypothetical protein OXE99_14540 [Cellvibrionales bacterium]|nr:hypothetical protein [Cellvibrionales bacterium]